MKVLQKMIFCGNAITRNLSASGFVELFDLFHGAYLAIQTILQQQNRIATHLQAHFWLKENWVLVADINFP